MKKIWVLAVLFFISCRKESPGSKPLQVANGPLPVTVVINADLPGNVIPLNFEGVSYETRILTRSPDVLNANNKVLIQLFKNLGPGILRIGGDSSDQISWTDNQGTNTSTDLLNRSDIDRLSAFSRAIGWPVLFGLNLGNNNVTAAANEAQYTYNSLQGNLYAFQFGNEPDIYSQNGLRNKTYSFGDYQTDWNSYFSVIRTTTPNAAFAGPDVAYDIDWLPQFSQNEGNNVNLIDGHYYLIGPATDPSIIYSTLLHNDSRLNDVVQTLSKTSSQYNIPYRITECNNVFGGGKAGVSDVFASALWALDFMWIVASNNGQGVNFHGGDGLFYSPVTIQNGVTTVNPEYYAMLAFKYGSTGGTIISTTVSKSAYNCSAYACANANKTMSVTLINKEEAIEVSFAVQLTKAVTSITVIRLSAPSVTASAGTTFAGSMVNTDGTFTPGNPEQYAVNQNSFTIKVPSGSAAIITMQ